MKIAACDKTAIETKILLTLLEADRETLPDPKQLLVNLYCVWYDQKIAPYKDHPLYEILYKHPKLNVSLKEHGVMEQLLPDKLRGSYTTSTATVTINSIDKQDLPLGYELIANKSGRWDTELSVEETDFPIETAAITDYKAAFKLTRQTSFSEAKKVRAALAELNTYGQLEKHLPIIFNSMPEECKEKFDKYKIKQRERRANKSPVKRAEFIDLGSTLAVAALKNFEV